MAMKKLKKITKPTIDISAVYLRREGDSLQVLVETDGVWRLVIDRPWPADGCGLISHIAEANGKFGWPVVQPDAPHPPPMTGAAYLASSYDAKSCRPCSSCGGMRRENCKDYPNHQHDWCDCQ
jgi:hypothetical protein